MENMDYSLVTDLYQLTMAYSYWKNGIGDREAVFNLYFRNNPFQGGFTVVAGLEKVLEIIECYGFSKKSLEYLASLKTKTGNPLFEKEFIQYLQSLKLKVRIDGVEEGRVVFPFEPLLRVKGPIIHCQLLETLLLNIINFNSLIATKACRVVTAAKGRPVLEFGLRRAQGIDGGLSASRAAYIGGCAGTSNVMAGMKYGIPVKGTHAHSWVMFFPSEKQAFRSYAEVMPENTVFLVDTYNTMSGIKTAIETINDFSSDTVGLDGIRLDSGDLAYLSQKGRALLDSHGFKESKIIASNDLDEYIIESLIEQKASIDVFGVGTHLVTGKDQPALGGVYKLTAIKNESGEWEPKLKISEQTMKINHPGLQRIRRCYDDENRMRADLIYDEGEKGNIQFIIDPNTEFKRREIHSFHSFEELLTPFVEDGKVIYQKPGIEKIREKLKKDLGRLHQTHQRLKNPHIYPVGLSPYLFKLRKKLIYEAKGFGDEADSFF